MRETKRGTIEDPAMDRYLTPQAPRQELADLAFDQYQALTEETAIYPRVFTETQVRYLLVSTYVRDGWEPEDAEYFASLDLDKIETPFNRLVYPVLGLLGEAGEIANKLKKVARDGSGSMDLDKSEEIQEETGDVLWYVARVATELKASLGEIAADNVRKLLSRKERGKLGGSGDKR